MNNDKIQNHQPKKGLYIFARELMANPRSVGAAAPSSKQLAKKIAQQVPKDIPGKVIEIGAGTGAVTQALLNKFSNDKLVIIERSEKMAEYLHTRFKKLNVIQADAQELSSILIDVPVSSVVSGLPMRSLPASVVDEIEQQINQVLTPGGYYILFTYDFFSKPRPKIGSLRHLVSKQVWLNLPPARVDVYIKE